MKYIRFPLSLRQVEDLLHERGMDLCHETVRFWWNRVSPLFAAEIRKRRVHHQCYSNWRWHLDEVFVKINGEMFCLWRAVDHEGDSHRPFRRREGAIARFRDLKTLQKFVSTHASIHNLFNVERHLIRRSEFKENRSAALAEWRQLAA